MPRRGNYANGMSRMYSIAVAPFRYERYRVCDDHRDGGGSQLEFL